MSDFKKGFSFWWRGWGYILTHPGLLATALLPALLALGFAVGFIWIMWTYLGLWVQQLITAVLGAGTGLWYSLAYYPLLLGGGLVVFLSALYVSFLLHAFLAVPFYSMLAEKTLRQLGLPTQSGWSSLWRMFRVSAIKALLLLIMGVFLFVLSFVPVLNVAAMLMALMVMAFDCVDYSFECLGYGLSRRLSYLVRERNQWLGMATALALTLLLPGLTLLITPGAVVGGALILKEQE